MRRKKRWRTENGRERSGEKGVTEKRKKGDNGEMGKRADRNRECHI
jgi:hypothetical protein